MNYRYWFNPNIGHCNENPLVENKLKYRENLKFTEKYFMISTPIKTWLYIDVCVTLHQ